MKGTGGAVVAASVAAVVSSAAVLSYAAPLPDPISESSGQDGHTGPGEREDERRRRSVAEDKFAPRFDGLRFIETLVTAHR